MVQYFQLTEALPNVVSLNYSFSLSLKGAYPKRLTATLPFPKLLHSMYMLHASVSQTRPLSSCTVDDGAPAAQSRAQSRDGTSHRNLAAGRVCLAHRGWHAVRCGMSCAAAFMYIAVCCALWHWCTLQVRCSGTS